MHTFVPFLKYEEKLGDFKVSSLWALSSRTCQNIGFHSDQEHNATQVQLQGITELIISWIFYSHDIKDLYLVLSVVKLLYKYFLNNIHK